MLSLAGALGLVTQPSDLLPPYRALFPSPNAVVSCVFKGWLDHLKVIRSHLSFTVLFFTWRILNYYTYFVNKLRCAYRTNTIKICFLIICHTTLIHLIYAVDANNGNPKTLYTSYIYVHTSINTTFKKYYI